jgi:hypothetical protein
MVIAAAASERLARCLVLQVVFFEFQPKPGKFANPSLPKNVSNPNFISPKTYSRALVVT